MDVLIMTEVDNKDLTCFPIKRNKVKRYCVAKIYYLDIQTKNKMMKNVKKYYPPDVKIKNC